MCPVILKTLLNGLISLIKIVSVILAGMDNNSVGPCGLRHGCIECDSHAEEDSCKGITSCLQQGARGRAGGNNIIHQDQAWPFCLCCYKLCGTCLHQLHKRCADAMPIMSWMNITVGEDAPTLLL